MNRSSVRAAGAVIVLILCTGGPAAAQSEQQPAESALQQQIRNLELQLQKLQQEIDALKAGLLPVDPADDLMSVEPIAPAGPSEAPRTESQPLDAAIVANPPPAAGKLFNPDISVIGNFLGHAGDENSRDERDPLAFDEAEIALEAFIDPYAKARFFIGVGEEVELEEGYIQFLHLPWDLTAKAGKMKASFGKFNTLHAHNWTAADAPLVSRTFFGDEGVADSGLSISKLIPNRFDIFLEATGEVFRGSVEDVFEPRERSDLLWLGRLKAYRDLSDSTNIEVGTSFASGGLEDGGRSGFSGMDVTYRWKPLARSIYRSFLGRTELVWNDRDDMDDTAFGLYASGDYQFARRWLAGLRLDRVERPDQPSAVDRGAALTLTFRPSEFSQIRGQLRKTEYADDFDALELIFQIQFSIGAHGAHTF